MQNDKIRGRDNKSVNSHKDYKAIRSASGLKLRDIGLKAPHFFLPQRYSLPLISYAEYFPDFHDLVVTLFHK